MKAKNLAKIAVIALPIVALAGCSSDTGISVDFLKIKAGHQNAVFRKDDNRATSDQVIFHKDAEPYDKSEISNGAVEATSPIWKHYQNRDK